eukprot:4487671-Amphidinium_carterae.1
MEGKFQKYYLHAVPKEPSVCHQSTPSLYLIPVNLRTSYSACSDCSSFHLIFLWGVSSLRE